MKNALFVVAKLSTAPSEERRKSGYHTDELDELQADGHLYSLVEMVDRPDHLVIACKQILHQSGLIRRALTWTWTWT